MFQDACVAAGIPAVTFWAAVPHYVSQPPNPKATVALLRRVEDVLDIEVPLADLPTQAEEWEQAVTEMTAEDDEIAEYVASLEERGDAEVDMTEALGKIDGDALAAEFERYLRRRGPGSARPYPQLTPARACVSAAEHAGRNRHSTHAREDRGAHCAGLALAEMLASGPPERRCDGLAAASVRDRPLVERVALARTSHATAPPKGPAS